jgi:exonuclease VII small subunit
MSEEDEIESLNAMLSRIEVADLRLDQAIETLRNSID